MGRARGANAKVALAINSGAYGAILGSGFYFMPFSSIDLGEEQELVESDLLGYGRDPQDPSDDVINNEGGTQVPVDLRLFGYWLKLLLGAPTTTTGVAAAGSLTFSAQPANNATITINGTVFTFVSAAPAGNQIQIGSSLAETVANAVVALNASADVNVSPASYSADIDLTQILVTHDTIGTAGNAFTLAAGSSPASNATVSGATLAGGSASGPKNHEFIAGSLTLPDANIEIGHPDVPAYFLNYGVLVDSLSIPFQRSGHLNATLQLIAQGEKTPTTSTAAGTPTELDIERFSQFSGAIYRDGVPLGSVQSGRLDYRNGMEKDESIRSDGRIAGADPGGLAAGGEFVTRFKDLVFYNLAVNKTPVEIVLRWSLGAGKSLTIILHRVRLPKKKRPISGPGGVQQTFPMIAAEHKTVHRTMTVRLVNDVNAY